MSTPSKVILGAVAAAAFVFQPANAADFEVTHWWTSGAEAAAIRVIADAFENTGNHWVDGAIAGAGGVARPLITSRITGGDPMGATQFTHGKAMRELIEAGFIRDVSDIAEKGGWQDLIFPQSLLESCTFEGKLYCVPTNIHSQQWLWLNNSVFENAGLDAPKNWDEFVAAGPALREQGIIPLATGRQAWQLQLLFNALMVSIGGPDLFTQVYGKLDHEYAAGPEVAKVFKAAAEARDLAKGSNVQEWNLAARMVIDGRAAGQIMGDWVQGEFAQAGMKAGKDFSCLPGLGVHDYITAAGDAFYFPKVDDPDVAAAQEDMANVIVSQEVQVAFNLTKGALPVRRDVDIVNATDCMKKGMEILKSGHIVESVNSLVSPDTVARVTDLMVEFFSDDSFTADRAQQEFAEIISTAD